MGSIGGGEGGARIVVLGMSVGYPRGGPISSVGASRLHRFGNGVGRVEMSKQRTGALALWEPRPGGGARAVNTGRPPRGYLRIVAARAGALCIGSPACAPPVTGQR